MTKLSLWLATGAVVALTSAGASAANLIMNGGFTVGLDGLDHWTETGSPNITPGVVVVAEVANLGQTGTPGTSTLSQTFNLTNANLTGSFDATWRNTPPTLEDFFSVSLTYAKAGGGTKMLELGPVGSNSVAFNTLFTPTGSFTLDDFAAGSATLTFTLVENNSPVGTGTFVAIDNVQLSQVPLPAAAWLFGSALLGLVTVARRKATTVTA